MIDSRESAETLRKPFHFDHRFRHRDQSKEQKGGSARRGEPMARAQTTRSLLLPSCFPDLNSSFHSRKINVRRHSSAQTIVVTGQTNLHAKYLFDAVGDSLNIARSEFGLSTNLLDNTFEIGVRK